MQQPDVFRALNTFQPMLDTGLWRADGPSKLTMGEAWQEIQLPGYCCIIMNNNVFKIHPGFQLHLLCPVKIFYSGSNALWWFKIFVHFGYPLMHTCHLALPASPLAFYFSSAQVTPSPQHQLMDSVWLGRAPLQCTMNSVSHTSFIF